jgi:hypothetical protein
MFHKKGDLVMSQDVVNVAFANMLAYLDPGSGSMLIQLLLAALLGAGVLLRTQWNKIKALFGKKDATNKEQDEGEKEKTGE